MNCLNPRDKPDGKADLRRNEVEWWEHSPALGSVRGMPPPGTRRTVGALSWVDCNCGGGDGLLSSRFWRRNLERQLQYQSGEDFEFMRWRMR